MAERESRAFIPIVSGLSLLIGLVIGVIVAPQIKSAMPPLDISASRGNYNLQASRAQTYTIAAYGAQEMETDSYGDALRPGTAWLVVDVELINTTGQPLNYNCLDLTLRDSVGHEYTSETGPSPSVSVGNLLPGEKVRGYIAFEVLEDAQGFTLLYEDQRVPLDNTQPAPTRTPRPTNTPKPPTTWHDVARIEGKGVKQSEIFTIQGDEWRISWETGMMEVFGTGILQITVFDADSGTMKTLAANVMGADTDSTIMRGAGNYYLAINAAQPYVIVIEERY